EASAGLHHRGSFRSRDGTSFHDEYKGGDHDPVINTGSFFVSSGQQPDHGVCARRLDTGPMLFFVVLLIEGATRPGYNALRTEGSYLELSSQGWEQIANFIVCGLLCIAFAVGLRRIWRTGRASVWGPLLVGLFGLGLLLAGVFVTDPGGGYPPGAPINGMPQTWHGWVHGINGLLFFNVVLPATCFVLAW